MNASMVAAWAALAVWFTAGAFVSVGENFRLIPIALGCACVAVAVMFATGEWA